MSTTPNLPPMSGLAEWLRTYAKSLREQYATWLRDPAPDLCATQERWADEVEATIARQQAETAAPADPLDALTKASRWGRPDPRIKESPMSKTPQQSTEAALAEFTEYFVKNYPGPNTIISDPLWHAPKIFRAAEHAIAAQGQQAETAAPSDERKFVPGVMFCARCKFKLTRISLNVNVGTVTAGDNKTEPCPNGCGPMWPVTWEQEAKDCYITAEQLFERADAAEKELADLKSRLGPKSVAAELCPHCGSEEWDNVTAERGRERDVPFNRCNRCEREWEAAPAVPAAPMVLKMDEQRINWVPAAPEVAQRPDPMAAEYQRWIDFYHAGDGDYSDFLKRELAASQRQQAQPTGETK